MIRVLNYPFHKGKEAATMKIAEFAQQRNPEQITEHLNSLVDELRKNVETGAQDGDSFDCVGCNPILRTALLAMNGLFWMLPSSAQWLRI